MKEYDSPKVLDYVMSGKNFDQVKFKPKEVEVFFKINYLKGISYLIMGLWSSGYKFSRRKL